ncbi:MAG: hypothetical protein ACOCZK_06610, partial [Planctomycetota bacterium]
MRPSLLCLIALALAAGHLGAEDEFDALMARWEPPARFADHTPAFTVEKQTFEFAAKDGTWTWDFWVIKDHDRYVGVMPLTGFHGGTFYLLTHDPAQAPTELPMPSERWHIDTAIGYAFRTDQFIPDRGGSKEWNLKDTSDWQVGDDAATLTLTRTFKGSHAFAKWEHRTDKREIEVDHTGTFTLACHPQLGYTFTGTWDTGLSPGAPVGQYVSLMPPGLSDPWPEAGVCQRVAICPTGSDGYEGWALNGTCVDKAGGADSIRNGGFGVYLDPESGWSCGMTLAGGDAKLSICNVHADLDYIVQWPEHIQPDADGLRRHPVTVRMVFFPPELTAHVWAKMAMRYVDAGNTVVIGLGETQDFEDQPLDLSTTKRGITFGFSGHRYGSYISSEEASSGEQSLKVQGEVWPNIPQVVLEPGVRYRLEAKIKVVAPDEAAMAADRGAHDKRIADIKQRHAKQVAKATRKDKPIPEEPELPAYDPTAGACIRGYTYQWSPHNAARNDSWVDRHQTALIEAGAGWQPVSFEFVAPDWGPFIDIRFRTTGGATAYVDEFRFAPVTEAAE